MLSVFPELFFLAPLAVFLLRVVLGLLFIWHGYSKFKPSSVPVSSFVRIIGLLEVLGGISLVLGFVTQLAALVLSIIVLLALAAKLKGSTHLKYSVDFYILLFVATFSLVFLGPGAFAIDLPL